MDRLRLVWGELTLGPVSVFSALFMVGLLALLVLAYRDIRFKWGVYLALGLAVVRMPVVRHKRELLGDHDSGFVTVVTVATFLALIVVWTFFRWFSKITQSSRG